MIIDRAQGYDDDKERHNQQVAKNHCHDADERNERQPKGKWIWRVGPVCGCSLPAGAVRGDLGGASSPNTQSRDLSTVPIVYEVFRCNIVKVRPARVVIVTWLVKPVARFGLFVAP